MEHHLVYWYGHHRLIDLACATVSSHHDEAITLSLDEQPPNMRESHANHLHFRSSNLATKQVTPEFGLCVDWETSGAAWGKDSSIEYQGIQIGIIVFRTKDFSPVEKLKIDIKFDASKYKWSPEAEKIHGLTREYLEENGFTQEEAAGALLELILKYWGPDNKVMFLGHNPEFDRRFTNQLTMTVGIEFSVERTTNSEGWIQMHHVVLDTSALGFITMGLFKSDLLFEAMGFNERGQHDALQDASQTLETCAVVRMLVKEALGL
jgi:DNA polymerase III epsilon subunit-like protein